MLTDGFTSVGQINLFAAEIQGQLWLTGAHIDGGSNRCSLNAPQLKVAGGIYCQGLETRGTINLYGAAVGATLEFKGATLDGTGSLAIRAPKLTVAADTHLTDGTTADGGIDEQ
jgi:hypothetical protein